MGTALYYAAAVVLGAMVMVIAFAIIIAAIGAAVALLRATNDAIEARLPPHWEAVEAADEDGPYGWKVRWSEPDAEGRYLCVAHYHSGNQGDDEPGPSLGWCQHAAERDALRMNSSEKRPEEYPSYFPRSQMKGSEL